VRPTIPILLVSVVCTFLFVPAEAKSTVHERIRVTAITRDDGWRTVLQKASSLFYDRRAEELIVADTGNSRILIYDHDLNCKYSFRHFVRDYRADRLIPGEPRAAVTTSLGEIVVIDNLVNYVDILDFRGRKLEQIELNNILGDSSLTVKPQCLAIDPDDNLYIGTVGDITTVAVMDRNLELRRTVGQKGDGPGDFNSILSLHVSDDTLYVADMFAVPAVKVFDIRGHFLYGFGAHGIERTDLSFPNGITVLEDGVGATTIWIVDGLRQVIKVYGPRGEFAAFVGGFGYAIGEFRYPSSISAASDSVFYVLEKVGNRIQRFEIR
jgi:hypothetical protein